MTTPQQETPRSEGHKLLDRLLIISLAKNHEAGRILADRIEELERELAAATAENVQLRAENILLAEPTNTDKDVMACHEMIHGMDAELTALRAEVERMSTALAEGVEVRNDLRAQLAAANERAESVGRVLLALTEAARPLTTLLAKLENKS